MRLDEIFGAIRITPLPTPEWGGQLAATMLERIDRWGRVVSVEFVPPLVVIDWG